MEKYCERREHILDEMKIVSKFTRGMIAKIVRFALKSKLGYDIDILLNEFNANIDDNKARVHLSIDADLQKDDMLKMLKTIGLF